MFDEIVIFFWVIITIVETQSCQFKVEIEKLKTKITGRRLEKARE